MAESITEDKENWTVVSESSGPALLAGKF